MKKYLPVISVLILALTLILTLAACTGGRAETPSDTDAPASEASPTGAGDATDAPAGPAEVTDTDPGLPTETPTGPEEATTAGIQFIDWPEEAVTRPEVSYDDTHAWVFSWPEDAAPWGGSGANIGVEQGALVVRPTTHDPIVYITLRPDEYVDAADYHYIAYRYRAETRVSKGVFFVGSTNHQAFSDAGLLYFDVRSGGEWVNLIMDMSKCPFWCDEVTKFRIDPINSGTLDEGSCIRIERVGFFRSEDEAAEFLNDSAAMESGGAEVLAGEMAEAYLPAGVYSPDLDPAVFLPASCADGANAVTLNGTVIPMSYVNPVGFAFYAAPEAGSYEGVVLKTDGTALGFVQARGLLKGKSASDVLGKNDILTLMYDLTMDSGEVPDCIGAVEGGTVRDLCAALTAYIKAADFKPYKSVLRGCPVLEGRCTDALAYAWRIGLIGYDDLLDPDRALTAADAAGIVERMIKACLGLPVLPSGVSQDDMLIGCWYSASTFTADDVKLLCESGINMIVSTGALEGSTLARSLKMADELGVRVLIYNYAPGKFDPANPVSPLPGSAKYYDYPSCLGNTIYDEPGSDDYPKIADITAYYGQVLPGKVPFYNLLPMYANAAQLKFGASADKIDYYDPDPDLYRKYVEAYAQQVDTDYICVDIYPNRSSGKAKATYDGYLKNMDIFSTVCREYDRDFWLYVQTTGLDGIRVPDYDDMRWQMYVGLSFGVKTFIHFTYNTYDDSTWTVSMVDTAGKPTSVYEAAQKANLEVAALSRDYLSYRNLGAYAVNIKPNMPYAMFDNQYEGIDGVTVDTKLPLLVGCFGPVSGSGCAFTLVNMTPMNKRGTGTVTFTVPDGASVVTVWQAGVPTVVEPVDGKYTVGLAVAEGVFVTVK